MSLTRDELRSSAMELDPAERQQLAEELLLSIAEADQDAIDAAWLAEVKRRDAALGRGAAGSKPVDEVIGRLMSRTSK